MRPIPRAKAMELTIRALQGGGYPTDPEPIMAWLEPKRIHQVRSPKSRTWMPDETNHVAVLSLLFDLLAWHKHEPARSLLLEIYDRHEVREVARSAGRALLFMASDTETRKVFGMSRAQLQRELPQRLLSGAKLEDWVDAYLRRKTFKACKPLPTPKPTPKLANVPAKGPFGFPFFHHGMTEELDDWAYVVQFRRAPLAKLKRLLSELLPVAPIHFETEWNGRWLRMLNEARIGGDMPPAFYRALRRSVDQILVTMHREQPIAMAAMVDFGHIRGGDAWHRWSAKQGSFEEMIDGCPFLRRR